MQIPLIFVQLSVLALLYSLLALAAIAEPRKARSTRWSKVHAETRTVSFWSAIWLLGVLSFACAIADPRMLLQMGLASAGLVGPESPHYMLFGLFGELAWFFATIGASCIALLLTVLNIPRKASRSSSEVVLVFPPVCPAMAR